MKKNLLYGIAALLSFSVFLPFYTSAASCGGSWQCGSGYSLTGDLEPDGTPNCIEDVCSGGAPTSFSPVTITNGGGWPDYTVDARIPTGVNITADIDCTYTPTGNVTYILDTSDSANCGTVLGGGLGAGDNGLCRFGDIDLGSFPNLNCTSAYNITVTSGTLIATDGYLYTWNGTSNVYDPVPVCLTQNASCGGTCLTDTPIVCDINDPGLAGICYIPDYYGTTLNVSNGFVGINTPTPAYPLDVEGTIRAGGIYRLSDVRFKSSITKIDNALEKIRAINGYSFTWKDSGQPDLGVLAQEIEKVFADAVSTDKNGKKSVQYAALIAPILEALDELSTQIDTMASEQYKTQSNRLDTLEMRIK